MNRTETSQGGTEQEVVAEGVEVVETAEGGTEEKPKVENTVKDAEPAKKYTCRYDLIGGTPCTFGVDDPGHLVMFTREDGSTVKIPAMSVVFKREGQPVRVTQGEKSNVLVWICHTHVGDVRRALVDQFRTQGDSADDAKRRSMRRFLGLDRYFEQQRRNREEQERMRRERERQHVAANKVASFLLSSEPASPSTPSPQPAASAMPLDPSAAPLPDKGAGRRGRGKPSPQHGDRPHAGHREEHRRPRVVSVKAQSNAAEPQPTADSGAEDEKGGKSATPVVPGSNPAPEPATATIAAMAKGKDGHPIKFVL